MNSASRTVVACFAALLACATIPRTGHAQAPSPGVFSELQTALVPQIGPALEPATMRSRIVSVDTQQIAAARQGRDVLSLNLFDDAAVQVMIDRVRPTRSGYFISGRPQGMEWGEVRLVVNGPVVVGTVVTPQGKFTIRWGGSGRHIIRQIDPSVESIENDEVELDLLPSTPPETGSSIDPLGSMVRPASAVAEDTPTEDGSEVRVLVVYTPAMQTRQGGAAGMQTLIDLMIHSANDAFEISGINPRLVLTHSALVNYVEEHTHTDLFRIAEPDDGYMDEVHALRNEYAADLVHLLTFRGSGPAGSANRLFAESLTNRSNHGFATENAFAVTANGSEETFTHETGHNFGLRHDRFVNTLHTTIYPYAFGYVNNRAFEPGTPVTARWRTIMAYGNRCSDAGFGCPRLMRFSNPDQTHDGDPLGVPADDPATGPEGPADARLTINRTARWVGSFRSEACTAFTISPETPVAPVDGGEVVLQVETTPGCLWEASSQSAFLTQPSDPRQSGPRFVSIAVEANQTEEERIGTLTVAGKNIEVRQLATDAGICSRTPTMVRAIADALPRTSSTALSCDEVTDQHLAQITVLRLGNKGLTSLKAGDFAGLSGLENLSLEANRLSDLPEDLFAGLSNLKYLALPYNQLTELPKGLFASLSKLQDLRLDSNPLDDLPQGLFSELPSLRYLWLDHTRLTHLAPGLFADLAALEELRLGYNYLSTLPEGVFAGLGQLKKLDLSGNQLVTFSSRPFADLPELEELNLVSNQFSELPENAFASLPKLKILNLGDNPLATLPGGIFAGLSNLTQLLLYANRMAEIPPDLLAGLSRLNSLVIGGRAVTALPEGLFSGLSALKELEILGNQFSSLPDGTFAGLTSLENLKLARVGGEPLPIPVSLEKAGDSRFKAVVPTGAPFALAIPVSSDGGTIEGNDGTVTIPVGAVESMPLSVARAAGMQQPITVDIGTLPDLPDSHSGYVLEKDEALPLSVLQSIDPADASLSGLSLSQGTLDPAFEPDTTSYKASVANAVSSTTVTPTTSNASATATFHDESDAALADADPDADGNQVSLNAGENVFKVEVTAENGTSTRTYTFFMTREDSNCNRTEEVLNAIVEAVSSVDACDYVSNAHLAQISTLDLNGQGISSLKSGDFAGLSALETLYLHDNQLTALPADIFSGLSSLRSIGLWNNQLESLPDNLFSELPALRAIQLSSNRLTRLPDGIFSRLTRLEDLALYDNQIASLSEDALSGLSSLKVIWLMHNKLTSLPANTFSGLSSLTSLYLRNNELSNLPASVLSGLSSLKLLFLEDNELRSLPAGVFSGLSALDILSLQNNELTKLPPDVFADLSALRELNLNGNALTRLPPEVFSGLSAVQRLFVSDNQLTTLPDGLFRGVSRLLDLDLGYNKVHPLPLPVSLEKVDEHGFKAVAPTGAPFALELPLRISSGGEIEDGASSVSIPAGAVESVLLGATKVAVETDTATVDIGTLPAPPGNHRGYVLEKDATLPIEVLLSDASPPPAQVTGLELTPDIGMLEISWTAVADANGYKVQWKSGEEAFDEARQAVIESGDTVSYTISGLTAGIEYTVRVIATRENAGDGAASDEVTGTPQFAPLAQVAMLEIRARINQLRVSWTAVADADGYKVQWKSGDEAYDETRQAVVAGGDAVTYSIAELTAGTGYTVRVIATGENVEDGPPSEEVTATPRSGDPDVNGDGVLDTNDAQVMLYAFQFEGLVGDGETGGTAESRQRFLAGYSGRTDPSDEDLQAMLRSANAWRAAGVNEGGDINDDGVIDGSDAYAMYYAYAFESLLGNGEEGGTARFRSQLLGPLAGNPDPTDEDLKDMLRKANRLREEFSK